MPACRRLPGHGLTLRRKLQDAVSLQKHGIPMYAPNLDAPFADFQLRCWQIVLQSSLRVLPGRRSAVS